MNSIFPPYPRRRPRAYAYHLYPYILRIPSNNSVSLFQPTSSLSFLRHVVARASGGIARTLFLRGRFNGSRVRRETFRIDARCTFSASKRETWEINSVGEVTFEEFKVDARIMLLSRSRLVLLHDSFPSLSSDSNFIVVWDFCLIQ